MKWGLLSWLKYEGYTVLWYQLGGGSNYPGGRQDFLSICSWYEDKLKEQLCHSTNWVAANKCLYIRTWFAYSSSFCEAV